jgi:hypothetical protein
VLVEVLQRHRHGLVVGFGRVGGFGNAVAVGVREPDEGGRGLLPVGDHRGDSGGDIVVDRAHRRGDQRIHQQALALLELPDDQHPHPGIEQPPTVLLQSRDEVGPLPGLRGLDRPIDELN